MPEVLRISTLGGLDIRLGGKVLAGLASRKAEALLLYLACTQRQHARESLATMLWGESSQSRALANLSVVLSSLRKQVGDQLTITRYSVAFEAKNKHWVDLLELQSQLNHWQMQLGKSGNLPTHAADDLSVALAMYKGAFLAGFHIKGSPDFEEWTLSQADHIHRQVVENYESLSTFYLENNLLKKGAQSASRLLELDPLHEPGHRQMMELMLANGQRAAAILQYESCRRALKTELGVEPSEETQTLYESIISGKKIPNIPSKSQTSNIPAQLTTLIGRQKELDQIAVNLADPACRLLTLVGAGGIGKTRLGLQAAANEIERYPDGVWLIELAYLNEGEDLPEHVASTLGVSSQETNRGGELIDILIHYLQEKSLLLVLDNCEHLIDACATLSEAILKNCPEIKIVATSREKLGVPGEIGFPVPPLEMAPEQAPLHQMQSFSAVRLFNERAALIRSNFTVTEKNKAVISEITRSLDGIPLAIELAAARIKVLSLNQIAERLKDHLQLLVGGPRTALPRHKTLRATIDWSYSLLSDQGRVLLRRLSVFSGGWSLQAAEEITGFSDNPQEHLLEELSQLVEKSLVSVEEKAGGLRYSMLETVRQFGISHLKEKGEFDKVRRSHAIFFVRLAEHADVGLRDATQMKSLTLLDSEHDNLRGALRWALDNRESVLSLRLVAAMGWYWFMRGHWGESSRWLKKALKLSSADNPLLRAKAIYRAAAVNLIRGNLVGYIELVEEAADICRAQNDQQGLAWCLNLLGQAATYKREEWDKADLLLRDAAEIFTLLKNDWGLAWSIKYIGQMAGVRGNYLQGVELEKKALRGFEKIGDSWNAAFSWYLLGRDEYQNGDFEKARLAYEACQEKCRLVNDKVMDAHSLRGLAQLALHEGKTKQAEILFEDALATLKKIGDDNCAARATRNLAEIAQQNKETDRAAFLLQQSLTDFEKLGLDIQVSRTIERFAILAEGTGQGERAARLHGAVEFQLGGSDTLEPIYRKEHKKLAASLRKSLGARSFKKYCDEGAAMSQKEAAAYAIDI
jgi:predicted ATPase/DNA-binding SARP family transcriptional activator